MPIKQQERSPKRHITRGLIVSSLCCAVIFSVIILIMSAFLGIPLSVRYLDKLLFWTFLIAIPGQIVVFPISFGLSIFGHRILSKYYAHSLKAYAIFGSVIAIIPLLIWSVAGLVIADPYFLSYSGVTIFVKLAYDQFLYWLVPFVFTGTFVATGFWFLSIRPNDKVNSRNIEEEIFS